MAKILIIDDEERNRRLFEVFVRADGHQVESAVSGEAGLKIAAADSPDVILLDLMMPGRDGFEVARALKANAATQHIPIIVISSLDDVASHQRLTSSGIDDFIVKPIDRWELSQRIAKVLQKDKDLTHH
ncbi:MAG: response regulator [Burkholderiaceae bacterium]|nr:response regulator [Burkholderiaceae bacterium]